MEQTHIAAGGGVVARRRRRLLKLLNRMGDWAGAVLAYKEFAHRLSTDLEVEPPEETVAFIEAI